MNKMNKLKCRKIVISIENENIKTEANYFVGLKGVNRPKNQIHGLSTDSCIMELIGANSIDFYSFNISATKNNISAKLRKLQTAIGAKYVEFYIICDRDDYSDAKIQEQFKIVKKTIQTLFRSDKVFYLEYHNRGDNFETFLRLHFEKCKTKLYDNFKSDTHKSAPQIYRQVMYNSNGVHNFDTLISNIKTHQKNFFKLFSQPEIK